MPSIASGCFCLGPHHGTVALAARSTEGGPMTATTRARPEDLRAEHRDGFGLGEREPRLSWQLPDGAIRQLAYEVECEDGTSSRVAGPANVLLRWPFDPLTSGERREIRVRLETDRGRTDWSAPLVVEAGLLDASDWRATWVCTGAEPGEAGHRPAYRIRGEVQIDRPVRRARLYATAHGIYEPSVDGERIGLEELAPGYTEYGVRTQVQTYDVTALMTPGTHTVEALTPTTSGARRRRSWRSRG